MNSGGVGSYELTNFHNKQIFSNENQVNNSTVSSKVRNYSVDQAHKNSSQSIDLSFHQRDNSISKNRERSLAPVDGGFLAWRFIFTSFLVEGFVWGIPLSFGVFLDFPPYSEMKPSMAAVIATLCTGILYCIGSFVISLMENHPFCALFLPTIGTLVCGASFLAASYSTKAWQLLFFQGILYGIGGEWWVAKRGLAGSLMFAGTSVFGIIIPPLLDWALQKYGTPKTLRGIGAAFVIGMAPLLPFFQAFFVPTLYLPTYATSIGSPGGVVLALFSGASMVGQIVNGFLSDLCDLSWIIGVTSVASSISIFLLWGYSDRFAILAAFAIVYGMSAGGFSCLWQRFAMVVAPSEPNPGSLVVYFATSRGIANVLTGPIAGSLFQNSASTKEGYRMLIYYSGSLMMVCTVGVAIRLLHQRS